MRQLVRILHRAYSSLHRHNSGNRHNKNSDIYPKPYPLPNFNQTDDQDNTSLSTDSERRVTVLNKKKR